MKLFLNENDGKTNSEVFETKPFPKANEMWTSDDTEKAPRVKIGNLGIVWFLKMSVDSRNRNRIQHQMKKSLNIWKALSQNLDWVLVWIKFRKRKSDKRGLQLSHKSFCSKLSRMIDKIRIYVVFSSSPPDTKYLVCWNFFTKSTKTTKFIPHNQWL